MSAIATAASAGQKQLVDSIAETLEQYVKLMTGESTGSEKSQKEEALRKEYEAIMQMNLQLVKTESGIEVQKV